MQLAFLPMVTTDHDGERLFLLLRGAVDVVQSPRARWPRREKEIQTISRVYTEHTANDIKVPEPRYTSSCTVLGRGSSPMQKLVTELISWSIWFLRVPG